jgi:hypothetical protein
MSRAGGKWVCIVAAVIELWTQPTAVSSNLPITFPSCYNNGSQTVGRPPPPGREIIGPLGRREMFV